MKKRSGVPERVGVCQSRRLRWEILEEICLFIGLVVGVVVAMFYGGFSWKFCYIRLRKG